MVILAYCDGQGKSASLLGDAVKRKARELRCEAVYFPEVGLHPQFHMEIVDKYFEEDKDVIIATHSENILMRALRRISRKDIMVDQLGILQYLISKNNPGYHWKDLDFDEEGGLIDEFAGGLFEQGYNERFDMDRIKVI